MIELISSISSISGYSVQAIYGNPVSTRAVKPVSEDSAANRAMMTVSRNDEKEIQSQPVNKQDDVDSIINKDPVRSVVSGGEAEIVKQLNQLAVAIESRGTENVTESDYFSDALLQMGYQQNVRDKVASSDAQSQLAEMTQKTIDFEPDVHGVEEPSRYSDVFGVNLN